MNFLFSSTLESNGYTSLFFSFSRSSSFVESEKESDHVVLLLLLLLGNTAEPTELFSQTFSVDKFEASFD